MADSEPERRAEPQHEELRLALALNGGVSLAVWMGGCAVELDRARRADHDREPRRAYDALCKCFNRRLVIDIITGTSAGGINGALLGAAIAKERRLPASFVRERWIELGDLSRILHPSTEESPTALMDGKVFYADLLKTFEELLYSEGTEKPRSPRPPVTPALDVTMTDVVGVERRFRDSWGGRLVAREHRPRFRFRKPEHFTETALATAARTTASFPFAFDPWQVKGDARVLAGLPGPTYGIDGGLLDNAPIRGALDLIPSREARAVVRRYFCYVNADPEPSIEGATGPAPALPQVVGYAASLPRTAPLVDNLYAVRRAVERPRRAAMVQDDLLTLDLDKLEGVAASLFDSYVRRRTLESLEELVSDPGDANEIFDLLEQTGGGLPWIPREWRPGRERTWEWGVRPAQRILHLLLDLLRPAIAKAEISRRRNLLETRMRIDDQLTVLDGVRNTAAAAAKAAPVPLEDEGPIAQVNAAATVATDRASDAAAAVRAAAEAMRRCMEKNPDLFPPATTSALFGPMLSLDRNRRFLRRALAIEVVRRAFASEADVESAEQLHFVQLTPEAPSPIFTNRPLRLKGPDSAAKKLTGVSLHHFAGFYRRSWRANDYMWGRLDTSARLVDMLLDSPPADLGEGADLSPPERAAARAKLLVGGLLDAAADDADWVLDEVLAEAGYEDFGPEERPLLLEGLIGAELLAGEQDGEPLNVTRVLFQRAAQVEVLREELPEVRSESEKDRKLGSAAAPLELVEKGEARTTKAEVKAVRRMYRDSSLPKELTDPAEEVSNLGLQTISHAAFVALAAVRTAGMPMSKFFGFARPPLLAVAGTVARKWYYRATVAAGFWAAAMYLTSRLVGTEEIDPTFKAIWNPATLVSLAAVLGVAGVAAVPGLRARKRAHPFKNSVYMIGLLLTGGVLPAILVVIFGGLNFEQVLFTPGSELPSKLATWLVLAALGVASFARVPAPSWLHLSDILDRTRRSGPFMCLVLLAAFVAIAAFAAPILVGALDEEWWNAGAAGVALAGAPICAFFALTLWRRGNAD